MDQRLQNFKRQWELQKDNLSLLEQYIQALMSSGQYTEAAEMTKFLPSDNLERYVRVLTSSGYILEAIQIADRMPPYPKYLFYDDEIYGNKEVFAALIEAKDFLHAFLIYPNEKEFEKVGSPSLLPDDWRDRARAHGVPRLELIERNLIQDNAYGVTFRTEDREDLIFFRRYIDLHGDIDLQAAPDDETEPLRYNNLYETCRWWISY